MDRLVPIGRFATMSGVSVKALRHYDAVGILRPAHVDPATGYRSYDRSQLRVAALIGFLRSLDLPLDDVAAIVESSDRTVAVDRLERHRARLESRRVETERALFFVSHLLEEEHAMPYEIDVIQRDATHVVVVPTTVATTEDTRVMTEEVREAYSDEFRRLARAMRRAGIDGRDLAVSIQPREQPSETTIGVSGWTVPADVAVGAGSPFELVVVPAGRYATTTHVGPYEHQWRAFVALEDWLDAHDGAVADDVLLVFRQRPGNTPDPSQYLTELYVRLP